MQEFESPEGAAALMGSAWREQTFFGQHRLRFEYARRRADLAGPGAAAGDWLCDFCQGINFARYERGLGAGAATAAPSDFVRGGHAGFWGEVCGCAARIFDVKPAAVLPGYQASVEGLAGVAWGKAGRAQRGAEYACGISILRRCRRCVAAPALGRLACLLNAEWPVPCTRRGWTRLLPCRSRVTPHP